MVFGAAAVPVPGALSAPPVTLPMMSRTGLCNFGAPEALPPSGDGGGDGLPISCVARTSAPSLARVYTSVGDASAELACRAYPSSRSSVHQIARVTWPCSIAAHSR